VHDNRAAGDDLCRSSRCNLYRVSFYRPGRGYAGRLSYCPGKSRRASGKTGVQRLAKVVTRRKENEERSRVYEFSCE